MGVGDFNSMLASPNETFTFLLLWEVVRPTQPRINDSSTFKDYFYPTLISSYFYFCLINNSIINLPIMPAYTKFFLLFCLFAFTGTPAQAAFSVPPVAQEVKSESPQLERAFVEQQLGRKLKFKERIALSIVRGKAKRQKLRAAKIAAGGGPVDGYAVASLVCGILGFFTGITAIAAIVLGIISLGRFKRDPQFRTGRGMAIAGIALGGLVIIAVLVAILAFARAWS